MRIGSYFCALTAATLAMSMASNAVGQTAFGVNGNGVLFSFNVTAPGPIPVTTIGNLGFTPEAIDFRPGTNSLYAIDVGPNTVQLYTVNINSGAATAVGAGFNSTGAGYDLTGNQRIGFDFNPSTLQADTSMRIRLVSTNGSNLRLNSATGAVASVDTSLVIQPSGATPFVDGAAYLNNVPNPATLATTLYDLDSRNDALYTQAPPNNGQLNLIGPMGATVDANAGIGFDVYTIPTDNDPSITGDTAYAVLTRNATSSGAYLLYNVDLTSGTISNGKLVGTPTSADFTGGFAIAPLPIPEPSTLISTFVLLALAAVRRRMRS